MEYKTKDKLNILSITHAELNFNSEENGLVIEMDESLCRLYGEFFYCGLAVEGNVIITQNKFNEIIKKISIRIASIDEEIIYFDILSETDLNVLQKNKIMVECFGDDKFESDVDENYTFVQIQKL